ncbi:MAG TPA: copper resistance protein CopC, partial [Solirubrobacteraceae bacterium]|nr:copper resistance protein CopC [Solirubrobacteraceae bacterium]
MASAHPSLLTTSPGPGEIEGSAPSRLQLAFSERIELEGSSLRLRDPAGRLVPLGPLVNVDGAPGMAAGIQGKLRPGVYRASWVVLGDDGHSVAGDFRFGVALPGGQPPPGAASLSGSDPGGRGGERADNESLLLVAMRWLSLLSAAMLLGGALLVARTRRRLDEDAGGALVERERRTHRWLLAVSAIAAAEMLLAAAAAGAGDGFNFALLTGSISGVAAIVRLAVVVAAVVAIAILRRRWRGPVLAVAGALVLITQAIDGHVASLQDGRTLAALGQVAHVLGAGVWVGGLLALGLVIALTPASGRRSMGGEGLRAFAPIVAVAALVVVVTGTLAALREVDAQYFLRWSDYGRVVLAKAGLWLVLIGLGAAALLVLRRAAGGPGSPVAGRLLRVEALAGLVVVALAATLAGLVQGRGQPLPAQRGNLFAGATFATAPVKSSLARVTVAPGRTGMNSLTAVVGPLQLGEPAVAEPDKVQARLTCACSPSPLDVELTRT